MPNYLFGVVANSKKSVQNCSGLQPEIITSFQRASIYVNNLERFTFMPITDAGFADIDVWNIFFQKKVIEFELKVRCFYNGFFTLYESYYFQNFILFYVIIWSLHHSNRLNLTLFCIRIQNLSVR